jgi:hypothetical protein
MTRRRVPRKLRERLVAAAKNRCGYCLASAENTGLILHVEHLVPRSDGGATEESNLWLACADCNAYRSDQTVAEDPVTGELVRLFNPTQDKWADHFVWIRSGMLVMGITPIGRATVAALRMNRSNLVAARIRWINVGWHPPKD